MDVVDFYSHRQEGGTRMKRGRRDINTAAKANLAIQTEQYNGSRNLTFTGTLIVEIGRAHV